MKDDPNVRAPPGVPGPRRDLVRWNWGGVDPAGEEWFSPRWTFRSEVAGPAMGRWCEWWVLVVLGFSHPDGRRTWISTNGQRKETGVELQNVG